ncbi:DNA-binding HxlR family transcriptional regulator [Methanofollis sp. W23]|uniref:FHA domain-containing protein n=1 Tax=Methanofollis sp. W23 TaxID=2817849 RepID=UPI001AE932C2|nr:FHA domain-containing protein [Methanofollis sp. W23]MBP2145612.1 DNA-binding HxlR family transcriptional regulator [Methanofollis sp. W23]
MKGDEGTHTLLVERDEDFLAELSEYLDVLGSGTRLRILKAIERRPKDVREISREIETSYENTKKHLDRLLRIGVVRKEAGMSRPTAKGVHPVWKYSVVPGGMEGIVRSLSLFGNVGLMPADAALSERIAAVQGQVSEELATAVPVLMLLGGPDDGKVFPLHGERVAVGREDPGGEGGYDRVVDIVLAEHYAAVTRVTHPHALLSLEEGVWYLEDCGSTGGTVLNSVPLEGRERVALSDGDLIGLGKGMKGARLVVTLPGA